MNLIQPRLTIQNTDAGQWLVTLDMNDMGDGQQLCITLLLPKDPAAPAAQLQRQVLQRAHCLIGDMLEGRGTPESR